MTELESKLHKVNNNVAKGTISIELGDCIKDVLIQQEKYYNMVIEMADKFREIVNPKIESAKTKEGLTEIKEFLRTMPECADKVLIFRHIILKEESLTK